MWSDMQQREKYVQISIKGISHQFMSEIDEHVYKNIIIGSLALVSWVPFVAKVLKWFSVRIQVTTFITQNIW